MFAEQAIRKYIFENLLFNDDQGALNNSDSLLGKGIIDSTGRWSSSTSWRSSSASRSTIMRCFSRTLDSANNILAFLAKKQG